MPLFILAETAAGYALLKAQDKKLLKRDDLAHDLESVEDATSLYDCRNHSGTELPS
jgi:nucleolar protein 58